VDAALDALGLIALKGTVVNRDLHQNAPSFSADFRDSSGGLCGKAVHSIRSETMSSG
jgi:hypothetical protein